MDTSKCHYVIPRHPTSSAHLDDALSSSTLSPRDGLVGPARRAPWQRSHPANSCSLGCVGTREGVRECIC